MNIGRLNVWIELQKSTVTTDKYANRKNAWEPYYACYATVTNEAPTEESAAGQIVDNSKADFTIRYCEAAAAITATGYRVMFDGEPYNILGVDHMNYGRKAIKLLCQKVSR